MREEGRNGRLISLSSIDAPPVGRSAVGLLLRPRNGMADMEKPRALGFGLGLRPRYYRDIFETEHRVDWFEAISENYMVPGGPAVATLERVRNDYPIVLHGVSMSIASSAPLDQSYLATLSGLAERFQPEWISEHLCWTGVHGVNLHDLLPIPYTEEALAHVAERICKVQDFLGRRIAIENVSSYVDFVESEMDEATFLRELSERADCWLLLDVNNVFVSAFNHGFDPVQFIDTIPPDRVVQIHVAGHSDHGTHKIDTHDQPIIDDVWSLYRHACRRFGRISTLLERDDNFPPLEDLSAELEAARRIAAGVLDHDALLRSEAVLA
jgi:uncharacterized protein (UPF0276 family)